MKQVSKEFKLKNHSTWNTPVGRLVALSPSDIFRTQVGSFFSALCPTVSLPVNMSLAKIFFFCLLEIHLADSPTHIVYTYVYLYSNILYLFASSRGQTHSSL